VLNTSPGDADVDGQFSSTDLVIVFQAGQYEDTIPENSTWATGDWNGDGDFDSTDMVIAFQVGLYERGTQPLASEVAAAIDWIFAEQRAKQRRRAFVA
jgi:hypothetical protein